MCLRMACKTLNLDSMPQWWIVVFTFFMAIWDTCFSGHSAHTLHIFEDPNDVNVFINMMPRQEQQSNTVVLKAMRQY